MKKTIDLIKMFLCFAVLAAMSVGCSNTAILSGTDTASIETRSSQPVLLDDDNLLPQSSCPDSCLIATRASSYDDDACLHIRGL